MDTSKEPGIVVDQVFLQSIAFSHREDYLQLPPNTPAAVGDVEVGLTAGVSQDGEHGIIQMEVKTKRETKPIYNLELAMAVLIGRAPGQENMTIREFLASGSGVSLMYPFLREAVANVTLRGRFGPVWLNPINARAIAQRIRADFAASEATGSEQEEPPETPGPTGEASPKSRRRPRRRTYPG